MPKIKTPRSVILPIEVKTTLPASKLTKKRLRLHYCPDLDATWENIEIVQVQRANPVE